MVETTVGFLIDYLTPLVTEEVNLQRSFHSEVLRIKLELESIQCFLKDADMKAESEVNTISYGIIAWVKQLREVSFHIEDVVDEYIFYLAQHPLRESGFIDAVYKSVGCVVKLKPRHRIASQIRNLKKQVCEIRERSTSFGFDTGFTTTPTAVSWYDPRKGALYLEEAEVVGFESPRTEISKWLLDEKQSQRTVISVVGMGGLGKTTLAKQVYDSVKEKFDCHAWIEVSQSYQKEDLLKNIKKKFCQGNKEPVPEAIEAMDEEALTNILREYLRQKRYVVIFDDVWNENFWGDIEHALLDNNHGGRILITTRNKGIANLCKISSFLKVHELQPLPSEKAWELFCNKVFKFEHVRGQCPQDLLKLSYKIVDKCHGLPLAIVAIAGLLSTKSKTVDEWTKLHYSLSSELENNPLLISITRIISLSYSDLPHHLKSCFMYFGMYPEDYSIRCSRIVRQWIAEGFVKKKRNKTLEEVADEYLTELKRRSLVQVSGVHHLTGRARECRIHDLMREFILIKMEGSSFCNVCSENQPAFREGRVTRRLSLVKSSFDVLRNADNNSQVRSILNFHGDEILDMSILITQTKNFKLLKVLDFEYGPMTHVHEDVGNLFHLRYLSLRHTKVNKLPRSIGKLVNLETLDLKQSFVFEIPAEIYRLCKLRHLLGYHRDNTMSFCVARTKGIKIRAGIGCLKFLEKLQMLEVNEIGVDVIKEVGKLTQLRKLSIHKLRREDGRVLCECIEKMEHLESLDVSAVSEDDMIDLDYNMSSPPQFLRSLILLGRLIKLPQWIAKLKNLERFGIYWSKLEVDPLKTLDGQHNLVRLSIEDNAYYGELQFKTGVFPRLTFLHLWKLRGLHSIIIEEGALPNLENLYIGPSEHMREVPFGIKHLKKLKYLYFIDMPHEFVDGVRPNGQHHHIVEHISFVYIKNNRRISERIVTSANA